MEVKLTMFSPSHNASQSYFLHFQLPVNHFFLTIGEEVNEEKELLYMIRVHPLSWSVCASVLVLSKNGDGNDSCPLWAGAEELPNTPHPLSGAPDSMYLLMG